MGKVICCIVQKTRGMLLYTSKIKFLQNKVIFLTNVFLIYQCFILNNVCVKLRTGYGYNARFANYYHKNSAETPDRVRWIHNQITKLKLDTL